jgi:hypothetical protein
MERAELDRFLKDTGVRLVSSTTTTLAFAGHTWLQYRRLRPDGFACPACGAATTARCDRCHAALQARQHVLADFLIGAHAQTQAARLLTRDRCYYITYFPRLLLLN